MSAFGVKRCKNVFLLGTSHILRKHNLGLFGSPSFPPYVSIFSAMKISKDDHFLTPSPFPSAYVIYEWSLREMDLDGDGRVSYAEFMVKWKIT